MFIAHGDKFRKNARWIMAGVLILLIPGFVALFTTTGKSDRPGSDLPTIRGKAVDVGEYQQMMNLVQAQYLVIQNRELSRTPENLDRLKQEAIVQMLMHQRETELGIRVTNAELIRQIQSLPFLIEERQFVPERYRNFLIALNQRGVNEAMFEEVVRTQLAHVKLQELVTAAAKVTPLEVQQMYLPLHEKLTIDLIRFDVADFTGPVTVSNEDVRAFYEQRKAAFRTPAKVKVRWVAFPVAAAEKNVRLTDDEINDYYERHRPQYADTNNVTKPLADVKPEVVAELTKLRAQRAAGDRATELTVRLSRSAGTSKPDFTKVAAEFGVPVQTTDYFSANEKPEGLETTAEFAMRAFSLTSDQPVSDPIASASTNAYYVLEFVDGKPSAIPPFEEVAEKVATQVKRLRTYEAAVRHGMGTVEQLKKLVAAGKTFAQAAAELNLKVETPAPFTVADEKADLPAASIVQQTALSMPTGATSDFIQTLNGGLVFQLRDRQPADLADFESQKAGLTQQLLQRNRQALFNDWIQALIHQEQVDFKIRPRQQTLDEQKPS